MIQSEKVDDIDLMFNYFYDWIHERYRMFWNNYFRLVFGKPLSQTKKNS